MSFFISDPCFKMSGMLDVAMFENMHTGRLNPMVATVQTLFILSL